MTGPCFVADVMGAGLAVTVQADPVFVQADSSSTVDRPREARTKLERHSGFVPSRFSQRCPFDLLRLPSTPLLHALGAM
jgi:hypothetical protein